jgi:hypothetical protein
MLPNTFIIVVFKRRVYVRLYPTPSVYCVYSLSNEHESLSFKKCVKGGKDFKQLIEKFNY